MPHSTAISQYDYVPETKEDLDWADRELPLIPAKYMSTAL